MTSLLDPSAVVSGRSEAEGRISRLGHSLPLLVFPRCVRHLPFPDTPTRGTQAGMNTVGRSSWKQSIRLATKKHVSLLRQNAITWGNVFHLSAFISNTPFTVLPPPSFFVTLICNQQGEISDVPRFCVFYISFGLELIALLLSAVADVPPEAEERVKKVPLQNGRIF